jgi:peptidoglycan/LPS O-acetylase OafA/YrhL
MRIVAILFILAGHMGAIRASNVFVDVFFVLSGFLITTLMLAEHLRNQRISVARFYVRRAFRLMPALWVFLLAGLAVITVGKAADAAYQHDYRMNALTAFFYGNNWYRIATMHDARPAGVEPGGIWLGHIWSLSMEEQFYLLWPALLVVLLRIPAARRNILAILLGLIATIAIWRFILADSGTPHMRMYFGLDTHADSLLIGCTLAVWRERALRRVSRRLIARDGQLPTAEAVTAGWRAGQFLARLGPALCAALVGLAFFGPRKDSVGPNGDDYVGYTVNAAIAAAIIVGCDLRRSALWVRWLGARPLAWAGKRTFSIYLWHYPVISAANGALVPRLGLWPAVFVAAALSVFAGYVSFKLIETPAQRLRPAWASAPGSSRSRSGATSSPAPARPATATRASSRPEDSATGPLGLMPVPARADGAGRPGDWDGEQTLWIPRQPWRGPLGTGPARAATAWRTATPPEPPAPPAPPEAAWRAGPPDATRNPWPDAEPGAELAPTGGRT